MKRIFLFLVLFVFFSSLSIGFSNPFASTSVKTDIYSIMKNKYENESSEVSSDWISVLAQEYWVNESYISDILKWNLLACSIWNNNLLNKLNINTWSDYKEEDYLACYKQINKQFNNYLDLKITQKSLSNSLLSENLLANWKDDDSPYDLVVDVQDLSDVLFKTKMKKIPFWKVNIWKTWKSAAKSLWIWNDWNDTPTSPSAPTSSSAPTSPSVPTSPSASTSPSVPTSPSASTSPSAPTNSINTRNPDIQIWNQCWNVGSNKIVNNLKNIDNSNNTSINSDIDNLKNIDNSNWNNDVANNIKQDNLFNTFWLTWNKWWFIDWLFTPFSWDNNWWNLNLWWAWWWGWWCAGQDKLLSVCFKLVPSGPRWPVWWTSFVHSIEQEIDKIWDTLKDIKQSFIIPAGHGDEALDIDFKHIKFANIMAFNIVLTSKPVFNFKEDKKTEQEANVADTECSWVPHKLAVMYSRLGIAYCLNKWLDKDKYLFTNVSTVKIPLNPSLKPIKNTNSTDGIYNEEKNYSQFVWNILWFTTSLNKLMWTWLNSSVALEAKSE